MVIVAIERSERPIQVRDRQRSSEPWANRVFRHSTAKVRWAHSGRESEPGKWLELIVDEERLQAARGWIGLGKRWGIASIIE